MSLPRRLGRFARGFVSGVSESSSAPEYDPYRPTFEDYLKTGVRRSENLKDALGAAWRGASEEWQKAEERRVRLETEEREEREREAREREAQEVREGRSSGGKQRSREKRDDYRIPFERLKKYSPEVIRAYDRLGLMPGADLDEVDRKRREMVKKFHPDRFTDPEKRERAERVTAEINAARDTIFRSRR